ncbi:MAG: aminotransferase class I/II-fold pyridoxal phosphate-dependent enzyme [Gammaproteobacteria bacterium]|nr:aminotransferase class I/II-fold pyridoxal phosphate-dependent enzyme [Gammaproteobacteria bacterium]MDH3413348.1 aminotransferase class I/II-fold pyridoxal phosphate-dependent enzyme [Gammaproteobacteria bacterium]
MNATTQPRDELATQEAELSKAYTAHQASGLNLDLTRGKPSIAQLDLASGLDQVIDGNFTLPDGTDVRGYGGLEGIPEARALGAELLRVRPEEVLAGGNSSLTFMYLYLMHAAFYGASADGRPWRETSGGPVFLCPVPGYDRHFAICEDLGIEMLNVPMTGSGPDMGVVEGMIEDDPRIKGMWCVPRYSNPTGENYDDATVERIAGMLERTAPDFRLMWDDAYAVHALDGSPAPLKNLMNICRGKGGEHKIIQFASTSKITFAGGGMAFLAASKESLANFKKRLSVLTIGPDKVNQLRHVKFLKNVDGIKAHMRGHANILRPKFECVESRLRENLGNRRMGTWTTPEGGYFVSFYTLPGLAKEVVRLAGEAGVKLTPAGAAYPYGEDPEDSHIRLAPSYPELEDVDKAMRVFVTCVALATVRQRLKAKS